MLLTASDVGPMPVGCTYKDVLWAVLFQIAQGDIHRRHISEIELGRVLNAAAGEHPTLFGGFAPRSALPGQGLHDMMDKLTEYPPRVMRKEEEVFFLSFRVYNSLGDCGKSYQKFTLVQQGVIREVAKMVGATATG